MAEKISLEVPATLSALSTVRVDLGGRRIIQKKTLDDLDDLFLAADGLLEAALDAEELESIRVLVVVEGEALRVSAGAFRSSELRDKVVVTPGGCIDLCTLLRRTVDDVTVQEDGECFSVVITKQRTGSHP
jgi:hypothetical protein